MVCGLHLPHLYAFDFLPQILQAALPNKSDGARGDTEGSCHVAIRARGMLEEEHSDELLASGGHGGQGLPQSLFSFGFVDDFERFRRDLSGELFQCL